MASDIKREVRVGMMSASIRCRVCGCKPQAEGSCGPFTMVQVTVAFPLPELPGRFSAICEPCAVVIWQALGRPA